MKGAKIQTFEQKKTYKALRPQRAPLTHRPTTDIKGLKCEPRVTEGPGRDEMRKSKREMRAELKTHHSKNTLGARRKRRRSKNAVVKRARKVNRARSYIR